MLRSGKIFLLSPLIFLGVLLLTTSRVHAIPSSPCSFSCPTEMVAVCNKSLKLCIDRFEYSADALAEKPQGYMNKLACEDACKQQGKRLPSKTEWATACEGTPAEQCNIHRQNPVLRMYNSATAWVVNGVDCKKGQNRWSMTCMNDPRLNELPDGLSGVDEFQKCISNFGARDMVGNLGEWIGDPNGTFNGGLYPMPRSSCTYTTTAHGATYSDYSIGCRCAKTVL